ncbi:MAG: hypothetical protein ACR2LC_16980 [Pyrinomonadaceae bacterium]
MTNKQPDQGQAQAQPEPQQHRRAAARKPGRDVNEIFRIGEDVDDVPEFLTSIPAHNDVRTFVKHNYGGGDYLIKNRVGGKFKAERELHIEFEDDAGDESLLVNSSVESPLLSDDFENRIAEIAARAAVTAVEATERGRRTEQGQPNILDIMREQREQDRAARAEMREEMREMLPKENPAPAQPQLDPKDAAQLMLVKESGIIPAFMRNMRDMMHAPEEAIEPETTVATVANFLRDAVAPFVMPLIAPVISQRLTGLLSHIDDSTLMQAVGMPAVQPQPQPQAPPASTENAPSTNAPQSSGVVEVAPSDVMTLERLIENFKTDLQLANEPDDAIDDVVRLATEQPQMLPVIAQLMSQPNVDLIAGLSQATGVQLAHLANCEKYLNALRKGVKARVKLPPVVIVPASSNGNGAHAQAQAKTA